MHTLPTLRKIFQGVASSPGRIATMAVEHAIHLMARGDALENLAECREGVHGGSFRLGGLRRERSA
ncbi:hypothetical protein QU41_01340 [Bradyrhizobium elkanii]|nr:hypothetical protein QU41_01340 [Bradyrhizobium elkanii]